MIYHPFLNHAITYLNDLPVTLKQEHQIRWNKIFSQKSDISSESNEQCYLETIFGKS